MPALGGGGDRLPACGAISGCVSPWPALWAWSVACARSLVFRLAAGLLS